MIWRNNEIRRKYLIVALATTTLFCSAYNPLNWEKENSVVRVTIEGAKKKQLIRNFGASDAWSCQHVGLWSDEKRQKIVEWLFSKELDTKGNPKGIGLSLWRFNIGAGSDTQDNISDQWRKAECFLQADGSYDWAKQQGQTWFLEQAKNYEVERFLAFTNSPPIYLTKNGKAFSSSGTEANIPESNYSQFAAFLVRVLSHFKTMGIDIDYVSPFNEPQWDWTNNKQEGTPFTNAEIFKVTKVLDSLLANSDLATRIQIAEAAKLNYLFEKADKPTRGNQIDEFFSSPSPMYVGGMVRVDKVITGHSYFTSHPFETLYNTRLKLAQKIRASSPSIEFWQSEYCLLGNHEEVNPSGKDLGIDPALYVARIIHHDLTVANASSWSWWLAVSPYDYKDGLIYVDRETEDTIEDSKTLWALGNFSRFIRPDAQRIELTSESNISNPNGLMISSYLNPNAQLVIVLVNYSTEDRPVKFKLKNIDERNLDGFLTGPADDEKLKFIGTYKSTSLMRVPGRSIMTLVSKVR